MPSVSSLFPYNDFANVAEAAAKELEVGIVIRYDKEGELCVFGGGLLDGQTPKCKDFLWMLENVKLKMIAGDYV